MAVCRSFSELRRVARHPSAHVLVADLDRHQVAAPALHGVRKESCRRTSVLQLVQDVLDVLVLVVSASTSTIIISSELALMP